MHKELVHKLMGKLECGSSAGRAASKEEYMGRPRSSDRCLADSFGVKTARMVRRNGLDLPATPLAIQCRLNQIGNEAERLERKLRRIEKRNRRIEAMVALAEVKK